MLYDVSCIDYTWGLDRRKVSGNYTNASVAAIAASPADVRARLHAAASIPTSAPRSSTRSRSPSRGSRARSRNSRSASAATSSATTPRSCTCSTRTPRSRRRRSSTRCTRRWRTSSGRATCRRSRRACSATSAGRTRSSRSRPGETLLPVETAAWYLPQGGTVLVGQQRVTYGGLVVGGGGSLVGPGAAPTGAPNASLLPGAGVDVGSHDYAVTFKTATGESIPGPRADGAGRRVPAADDRADAGRARPGRDRPRSRRARLRGVVRDQHRRDGARARASSRAPT